MPGGGHTVSGIYPCLHTDPQRLTNKSQPVPVCAEIQPSPPSPVDPDQQLPTTAAADQGAWTLLALPSDPKVRRLKAEPPPDRGRGIPSLPAPARLRTHPIPALRHLAEGGDPPRLGRANKGLSHQGPEGGGAQVGDQRLYDGAQLPGHLYVEPGGGGGVGPWAGPSSLRGF